MTEALKSLTDGMVQIAQKQQTTRDALAKLFYRNAALNRSIPWGNEDEGFDGQQTSTSYMSATATPGKPASVTPEVKPVVQPPVAQPVEEKKSNPWSTLLPWALAALLGGGVAGYAMNGWFYPTETTPATNPATEPLVVAEDDQSSLYQYLEDSGLNVPSSGAVR